MNPREGSGYSAPIVYKAFAVLQQVAGAPSQLGISDLARQLNINKSTVFGITQALLDLGMMRQDETNKKFRLGPALIQLGNQSMSEIGLKSVALPLMEKLCHEIKQTVFLGRMDEENVVILAKADSPVELKITAPEGARIPFFVGAAAKTLLAFQDEQALKKVLAKRELPRFTENSITDKEDYLAELQKVRREGFARDYEEYIKGVNAVSVPLFGPARRLIGALWIVGFSSSFTPAKMLEAASSAKVAARQISAALGG